MFDATLLVEFKAGLDFKGAVILFERKQAGTTRFDVHTYFTRKDKGLQVYPKTDLILRQQENLVDNPKCQAGFGLN